MDERYPIGRFERTETPPDLATCAALIDAIEQAPSIMRSLVDHLTEEQLEWRYRPAGWTIRQVVHHVPDSHMNAYIRMKLAVTQESPTITTYDEARWAELRDVRSVPVGVSLDLLDMLHRRWVAFLRSLSDSECRRAYIHPERGPMTIYEGVAMYAWHGRHHAAHISNALRRSNAPKGTRIH